MASENTGEAWDDSALVQACDAALQQYQTLHDAAGGDALAPASATGISSGLLSSVPSATPVEGDQGASDENETADVLEDIHNSAGSARGPPRTEPRACESGRGNAPQGPADSSSGSAWGGLPAPGPVPMPPPPDLAADENLVNLMMAWYYAGYYTGLHQGRAMQARSGPVADPQTQTKPR